MNPQYTNVKVEGPSFPTSRASQFFRRWCRFGWPFRRWFWRKSFRNLFRELVLCQINSMKTHETWSNNQGGSCWGGGLFILVWWNRSIWVFPKTGVPQNAWFIMENPIKMDDFLETHTFQLFPRWWQLKYFWNFHPEPWGRWPHFDECAYFSNGLVQPPTSYGLVWFSSLSPLPYPKEPDIS